MYETVRYIGEGEELLMGPREPLQLQDMLGENTTDDRTDRETGGLFLLFNIFIEIVFFLFILARAPTSNRIWNALSRMTFDYHLI